MLSKLLNANDTPVSALPWRSKNPTLPKPQQPSPKEETVASEEVRQLRAQLAQLSSSAERAARQAHDAGHRAGELTARQAFEAEVRACTEKLSQTIAGLLSTRDLSIRRAEADTVRLALEIARRVLHRELSVNPSAIEALVKAALEKLRKEEVYRVRVHPEQEQLVRRCLSQMGRGEEVEIVGDLSQSKGGAFFEIARGGLDASVDMQLQEIERGLTDELEIRR